MFEISCATHVWAQQVFCYALSQNDGTEWRQRIQSEAEHFVDVSAMTSDMIARIINQDKIQILINLNGYTKVIHNAYEYISVPIARPLILIGYSFAIMGSSMDI